MKFWSDSFANGARIPDALAFAVHNPETHVQLSSNRNPHFAWSELPEGTRSLALICHDPDVPSRPDDVNQEGRVVPADLPRVEFFHWVLVDVPPSRDAIAEGELADGVVPRGKPGPAAAGGMRQGINDYTGWFAGDADMAGDYHGYDGPCPPWNDVLVHHYHFTLYALDVERCALEGKLDGPSVRQALEGHVLDEARWMGTYAINPAAEDRG